MANKEWWETFENLDCIYLWSWNDLTNYIQHSACTDFTIYSECTLTEQAFRFTRNGLTSIIYGNEDVDGDLLIYANDQDLCASIRLNGDGDIANRIEESSEFKISTCSAEELLVVSATELTYKGTNICLAPCGGAAGSCPTKADLPFNFYDDCDTEVESIFLFEKNGTQSRIYGGDTSGDQFQIFANQVDSYPYFHMLGDDSIRLYTKTTINFYQEAEQIFKFEHAGGTSSLSGSDDTGDDLKILANTFDDCASIELFGDAGMTSRIKSDSIFKISTCSAEDLFEVDSDQADKHVDFHCLDAHNFCLEIRTSNPSGPTCLGQLWFRSDLV